MNIQRRTRPDAIDRRFLGMLACLTVFAWLIRVYFIQVTLVEMPIRGDIRQYVAYAWNMLNHGTFSHEWPGTSTPAPDSFRGPGYPAFLAMCMIIGGVRDAWYEIALHGQAALGALTATATVLIARHWLSWAWALAAGILVVLWPHHIAATGALLSEVVLGFLLVGAMLATIEAVERRSIWWGLLAGMAFSCAALTNLIALLFPLVAALVLWRERLPKTAAILLAFALLGPGLWAMRNATLPPQPEGHGRMVMNVVQGSWPLYHRAYNSRNAHPVAADIIREIAREEALLASDPRQGVAEMSERMARTPLFYLRWYLLEKPFLLWDWNIRIGAGDVYFHVVSQSPLQSNPVLRAAKQVFEFFNPMIFVLSALASICLLAGYLLGRAWAPAAPALIAMLCTYLTIVHIVFQAEPRYSIPYRPMQLLMLATALSVLVEWVVQLKSKTAGRNSNAVEGRVRSP